MAGSRNVVEVSEIARYSKTGHRKQHTDSLLAGTIRLMNLCYQLKKPGPDYLAQPQLP